MQQRHRRSWRTFNATRSGMLRLGAVLTLGAGATLFAFQACVPDAPAGPDNLTPLDPDPGPADPTAPGSITVHISLVGAELPDSVSLALDGGAPNAVAAARDWTWSSLTAGEHAIELGAVPGNCTVLETNPQDVTLDAGDAVRTDFTIVCIATVGDLRVTTETSGNRIDDDGYRVELDGGVEKQQVEVDGSVTFTGLPPGSHEVRLRDVDRHCDVDGGDRVEVEVRVGEVAEVAFVVSCD